LKLSHVPQLLRRFEEACSAFAAACEASAADTDGRGSLAVDIARVTLDLAKRDLYQALGWQLFAGLEGANDTARLRTAN
jgi:hypothetical protein